MPTPLGKAFYHTIGGAVLDHLVPTTASAGLIVLLLRTIEYVTTPADGDLAFSAGWFAAVLFAVSVSQGTHLRRRDWGDVFLDIGEAIAMLYAFVALGFVESAPKPLWHFYSALLAFLLFILMRRRYAKQATHAEDDATPWITRLTITVCVVLAAAIPVSAFHWLEVDYAIIVGLWGALVIYVCLALWREIKWPPDRRVSASG